jgi:type II secretory pathway pseudopilin PulG
MLLLWRASARGFTRVELMVVASVMLVAAATAIPRALGSKTAACRSRVKSGSVGSP